MTFTFIWKLIDGDFYEQDITGCETLQEAVNEWFEFWGVHPTQDCEEFNIIMKGA
jgi:hypothetical protein